MHYARDGLGGDSSNGLLACLSRAMSGSSPASPAMQVRETDGSYSLTPY